MGRSRLWRIRSAAHARASKKSKLSSPLPSCAADEETEVEILSEDLPEIIDLTGIPSEAEETQWTGGVDNVQETDNSDFSWSTETESSDEEDGSNSSENESDHPD